jgi:hypothetical protein
MPPRGGDLVDDRRVLLRVGVHLVTAVTCSMPELAPARLAISVMSRSLFTEATISCMVGRSRPFTPPSTRCADSAVSPLSPSAAPAGVARGCGPPTPRPRIRVLVAGARSHGRVQRGMLVWNAMLSVARMMSAILRETEMPCTRRSRPWRRRPDATAAAPASLRWLRIPRSA